MTQPLPYRPLEDSEPLPGWLEDWVRAVLVDLQGEDPIDFPLGLVTRHNHRGLWHLDDDGTGQAILTELDLEATGPRDEEGLKGLVVEHLQEAFQESAAAWGQARPACPGHSHPATYGADGLWVCPASLVPIGRVGHIASGLG